VALQWTTWFLVAGAFHTTPRAALTRCSLVLAGGLFQTLVTAVVLRVQSREQPKDEMETQELAGVWSVKNLRSCMRMQTPVCLFSLRIALVVMAATEFYRHTNSLSGYWVPMTTVLGAWVAGLIAAYLHPTPVVLAVLIVFFAWWAFSVLHVNYALFTLALTAYIVFLLSLSGLPPATVVHRRAAYTLLGGAFALLAYFDVFRKTSFWIRADREEQEKRLAA
jgi:uncharacterized membrane protein YccC